MKYYEVVSEEGVEVRRTSREVAESDAVILRWLGKKAKVEESSSDDSVSRVR